MATVRAPLRAGAGGLVEALVAPDRGIASVTWARRTVLGIVGAAGGVLVALPKVVVGTPGLVVLGAPVLLAGSGLVLLAVFRPLYAWRIGLAWSVLTPLLVARLVLGQIPLGPLEPLLFLWGAWGRSRPALWWMAVLTAYPLCQWLVPIRDPTVVVLSLAALLAVTVALDIQARSRRTIARQAARWERAQAQRAVLDERHRIARELHDVVAHHLSLIAVQAETAPYRLGDLPASAASELGSISGQARDALSDMRRLLGVLRSDEPASRSPQPELSDVPALVAASQRAGLAVTLSMGGEAPVPAGVGLCAYRILQEALSNAARHAPGAAVDVCVEQAGGQLVLSVVNGPGAVPSPPTGRPGHGLLGMQERVVMLGGSLSVAPTAHGGFAVSASIPLDGRVGEAAR